jgi:hypothetical protein
VTCRHRTRSVPASTGGPRSTRQRAKRSTCSSGCGCRTFRMTSVASRGEPFLVILSAANGYPRSRCCFLTF